jgi:CDP-glucose 4,6-dehydratase
VAVGQGPLESLEVTPLFWLGKRVFLTGHTGFKGTWLGLWLHLLGARVTGYALKPPTRPSLFALTGLARSMKSVTGDVRDLVSLKKSLRSAGPQVLIHMAAQSLVRKSYADPIGTYATNVMGTANVLEAARSVGSISVILIVTSDKCYENQERRAAYREAEALGGHDPYSSSKGCAEILTAAYRRSFFAKGQAAVASVRAGNVIGGGDWSSDRLVPDAVQAFAKDRTLLVRNPGAVRPWQHVLDPLNGYLTLAEGLWNDADLSGAWNFGPAAQDHKPVKWVVNGLAQRWGGKAAWKVDRRAQPHEARLLHLDCSKARRQLKWRHRVRVGTALDWVVEWHRRHAAGEKARSVTEEQILRFQDGLPR